MAFGTEGRRALANVLFKTLSLPLDRGCRALLGLLAARMLGDAAYGRYQFVLTITTLLAVGTDLGLGIWTTRALARSRERAAVVVGTGLGVRSLAALPYAVAAAVAALVARTGEMGGAFVLLGVAALAGGYVDHFAAVLRGYERLDDEAWLNVSRAVLMALGGLSGLLLRHGSLLALSAGVMVGTVLSGLYGLWMLRRRYRLLETRGTFDRVLAKRATIEALPMWLSSLLSMLYFKGDTVLLRLFSGDAELGAYSVAFKVFEGAMIVPSIVLAAVFPPLARAHGDRERQRRWERAIVAVLLGLGLLVAAGLGLGSDAIVRVIYGEAYARAVPSLRVLALAVPLLYVNFGLTHFLIARNLEARNVVFGLIMLVVNVGLNLLLIPRLAGPGAAVATGVTEVVLTVCCLVVLRHPPAPPRATTGRTSA